MTMSGLFAPLHNGPHNSASDLTFSDYLLVLLAVAILVGVGVVIYRFVQRRRDEDDDDE